MLSCIVMTQSGIKNNKNLQPYDPVLPVDTAFVLKKKFSLMLQHKVQLAMLLLSCTCFRLLIMFWQVGRFGNFCYYHSLPGLTPRFSVLTPIPQAQKEQYLTYRRVFHGDTKDIFQHGATSASRPVPRRPVDTTGPTPFPGITNTAAAAMASILNRPQQPHGEFLIQAWKD